MTRSPLTRRAQEAYRRSMRDDLTAALAEHGGDLDKVAADPRVGCHRKNLHHYARLAGVDLTGLTESHQPSAISRREP